MSNPLQTRATFIQPNLLLETNPLELFGLLRDRGFNTVVLPLLQHGSTHFWASRDGELKGPTCEARNAITAARDLGFSIHLHVDFLSAGEPGDRRLGRLAARHRNWLMRTSRGRNRINQFPEVAGLFCWTTLDFRRYLCNLLTSIVASHPVDGILFDLRRIPRTTNDPRTWTHLGYSCLERIPNELGINIADFLNQPSQDTLRRIDQWRLGELRHFIEALKARVHVLRQDVLTAAVVSFEDPEQPWAPWLDLYKRGVLEEAVFASPPGPPDQRLELFDSMVGEPIPFLLYLESESELGAEAGWMRRKGVLGYVLGEVDLAEESPLEPEPVAWEQEGAPEALPLEASASIVSYLATSLAAHEKYGPFFNRLDNFMRTAHGALKYEDAQKIRRDVMKVLKSWREAPESVAGYDSTVPAAMERLVRLLALSPIPAVEY
jgi:hypothetical protein